MKLETLLSEIRPVAVTADPGLEIRDIRYDSRTVGPGDLFVAIVGFETDGHRYIGAAADCGAAAVVCETVPEVDIPYILVSDSRLALALLSARYFGHPARRMQMIGITGTNGKTTSTSLLKGVLEQCTGAKIGLIGTNRNMIGDTALDTERTTPESYDLHRLLGEMAEAQCSYVVMEVSSHALALQRVAGIRFSVGVFTNLSQDHLDFHDTMEDYGRTKARLLQMSDRCVVNLDDGYAQMMLDAAGGQTLTFAVENNDADLVAKNVKLKADGVEFSALIPGEIQRIHLQIPGEFSVYNALAVVGCARCLEIPLSRTADALSRTGGVKGRVEVVPTDGPYTILIDYAHTPDALKNVLTAVRGDTGCRVVVLFGCGGDRDRKKRPVMGQVAAGLADFVIVTSDNPRTEDPGGIITDILAGMKGTDTPYVVIEDRRAAIAYAIDNRRDGDIIVLAGKGHETYQEVNRVKHHMDEREIVARHLEARRRDRG